MSSTSTSLYKANTGRPISLTTPIREYSTLIISVTLPTATSAITELDMTITLGVRMGTRR